LKNWRDFYRAANAEEEAFLDSYTADIYPKASHTADIAVFNGDKLLLIRRGDYPFRHMWALPGGFLNMDETTKECAARELFEETHLTDVELHFSHLRDGLFRDPRDRIITSVYWCDLPEGAVAEAGDDAAEAEWFTYEFNGESVRLYRKGELFTERLAADHNECILEILKTREAYYGR